MFIFFNLWWVVLKNIFLWILVPVTCLPICLKQFFIGLCLHTFHCSWFSCLYSKMGTRCEFTFLTTRGVIRFLVCSVGSKDDFFLFDITLVPSYHVHSPQNASKSLFLYCHYCFSLLSISQIMYHVFHSRKQCSAWMSPRELNNVKTVNRPVAFSINRTSFPFW